jgi:hypothetical protein
MIDAATAEGKKDGYRFRLSPERKSDHRPIKHYVLTARPIRWLLERQRSFFTDESGVIRFTTDNRAATIMDPAIDSVSHR